MKKLFIVLVFLVLIVGGYYILPPVWLLKILMMTKDNEAVSRCIYKNEVVYYVPFPCCDQYNYLYNKSGDEICAPDGGFTGQGDGKCSDFSFDENSCRVVWGALRNK